jgi:predicted ferric reductase
MNMKKQVMRPVLIIIFALLIFSPLFVMPFVAEKLGRGWQRELSVTLGFVGLTLAGWQLAPVSRFTPAQKLFNMDRLYTFHHILSLLSALFVLVHYLLLLMNFDAGVGINNWALNLLNVFSADTPLRAQMGVLSILAYVLISITSVFRQKLNLSYDAWHVLHDFFTVVLVGAGLTHILLVGRYAGTPAMKTLLWAQTALWILAALYIRVFKPLHQLRHPYKITAVRQETEEVFSLDLTPQGFDLPAFHPGQVAWLTVRRSPFSMHRHPFSVASSAYNRNYFTFAIKNLGDFTSTIKDLKVGETVYIDGPFGYYDITQPENKGIVLIAGGIGIAPAMSILRSMRDAKDTRPVHLFYGHKVLQHVEFHDELVALEKQLPNFRYINVLEQPPADWDGYTGFITTKVLKAELPANYKKFNFFVCGPLPMMKAVRGCLEALEVSKAQAHFEEFEMA